jgi:hypothetical protein
MLFADDVSNGEAPAWFETSGTVANSPHLRWRDVPFEVAQRGQGKHLHYSRGVAVEGDAAGVDRRHEAGPYQTGRRPRRQGRW